MTDSVKVLTKGTCSTVKQDNFIAVKNYLIVTEADRRFLLVKLTNGRAEKVTGVTLFVEQYNDANEKIAADEFEFEVLGYPGKTFAAEHRMPVSAECVDCKIEVRSAEYEGYSYDAADTALPRYRVREEEEPVRLTDAQKKAKAKRKDGAVVSRNSLKMPVLITVIALIALFATVFAVIFYMEIFKATQTEFMISGVLYEFDGDDRSPDSDVYVTGISGGNQAVIPAMIEGHRVAGVRDGAFSGKTELRSLRIVGETKIGTNAFYGCTSLERVEIENVTEVGARAFEGCVKLGSVKFDGVKKIGERAFYNCSQLKDITVTEGGSSVTVGLNAFGNCGALKTVDIGRALDFGGAAAYSIFGSSLDISSMRIAEFSTAANGGKGVGVLFAPPASGESVEIEALRIDVADKIGANFLGGIAVKALRVDTLESSEIGDEAFLNKAELESIELDMVTALGARAFSGTGITEFDGNNIEKIGERAFFGCAALSRVSFENNLVLDAIPNSAFEGCETLGNVVLPASLTSLGERAFFGCAALTSVVFGEGSTVREINDNAFFGCASLGHINLPTTVRTIGERAFFGCTALESIALPAKLQRIGKAAFGGCGLRSAVVPDSTESIGAGAFAGCENMTSVSVPFVGNNVGRSGVIGNIFDEKTYSNSNRAQANRSLPVNLTTVRVTSSAELFDLSFSGCENLKRIELAVSPKSVGKFAFADCTSLTSISLGGELETIGEQAFYNCSSLTEIVLPDSLTSIGDAVLANCSSVQKLTVPFVGASREDNRSLAYFFRNADNAELPLREVYVTDATELAADAFNGCVNLRSVELNRGLDKIGEKAFFNCRKLNTFTLPETVTVIGSEAFKQCNLLYEVYNNSDLDIKVKSKEHGYIAYYALRVFGKEEAGDELEKIAYDGFEFAENEGEWFLVGYTPANYIDLPAERFVANGNTVEKYHIYGGLFSDDTELKTVNVPNAVVDMGEQAFAGCINLEKAYIAPSVKEIGAGAFDGCNSLRSVTLPGNAMADIPAKMFSGCTALTDIYGMPDRCASVGDYAFDGCASLLYVDIDGCESIGECAFRGCILLREISTGDCVTIGKYAFSDCSSLKHVELGAAIESIGEGAFSECKKLMEVTNLSGRSIGSFSESLINVFAEAVFQTRDERLPQITIGDCVYYCVDGQWLLVDYYGAPSENSAVKVNSFRYNGEHVTAVTVRSYAFDRANIGKLESDAIVRLMPNAFNATTLGSLIVDSSELTVDAGAITKTGISVLELGSAEYIEVSSHAVDEESGIGSLSVRGKRCIINDEAFFGANIGKLVVSGDRVSIYSSAFANSALVSSEIRADEHIGLDRSAFSNCVNMTSFTAESDGELVISENAFYGAVSLAFDARTAESISVAENAFAGAELTSFRAHSRGIVSIGMYAFYNTGKTPFDISVEANEFYTEELAFSDSGVKNFSATAKNTSLGISPFGNCEKLETISITTGGALDINGLASSRVLKTIKISADEITSNGTFFGDSYALTNFDLTATRSVTLGNSVLGSVYSEFLVVTVNAPAVTLSDYSVSACNFKSLDISAETVTVMRNAFVDCRNKGVSVTATKQAEFSSGAFDGAGFGELTVNTSRLVLPQDARPGNEYESSSLGFLTRISLSFRNSGVLVPYMFGGCGLQYANIDCDDAALPVGFFRNCSQLREVVLPRALASIGAEAFYGCSSLTSVDLPSSVTEIGDMAFYECAGLSSIKFPSALESIGSHAFYFTQSLSEAILPEGLKNIGFGAFLTSGAENVKIPSTLEYISAGAFNNCVGLKKLEIPSGVKGIGEYAFAFCYELTSVSIADTVTEMSYEVFRDCYALSSVKLPSGLKAIPERAFMSCSSLTSVSLPSSLTYIAGSAFCDCVLLASINIPASVETIGDSAFFNCYNAKKLTFGAPSKLTFIDTQAFSGCRSLDEINIPASVETIGASAFGGCNNAKKLAFAAPSKLSTVCAAAFSGCFGLTELTIPASVTTLEREAFYGCEQLEKITFEAGSTLDYIPEYAFFGCINVKTLDLPDSVTSIGFYAFAYMNALTSAELPAKLRSIGDYAFAGCRSLTYIKLPATLTEIGWYAFDGAYRLFEVCNLSTLPIAAGSDDYGFVAKHAFAVSKTDTRAVTYASAGSNKYALCGGEWYLYEFVPDVNENTLTLTLPDGETTGRGKVGNYSILDYACESGLYAYRVIVPTSVKAVSKTFYQEWMEYEVYYKGTEQQWMSVKDGMNFTYKTVCYYKECLHPDDKNMWTTDSAGNISFEQQTLNAWAVVKQPTCTEKGERRRTCPHCKEYYLSEEIAVIAHDYDEDHICKMCKQRDPNAPEPEKPTEPEKPPTQEAILSDNKQAAEDVQHV